MNDPESLSFKVTLWRSCQLTPTPIVNFWWGTIRRECLDFLISLSESHLRVMLKTVGFASTTKAARHEPRARAASGSAYKQ